MDTSDKAVLLENQIIEDESEDFIMDIPITDGTSQPFVPPPSYSQPQVSGSLGSSTSRGGDNTSGGQQRSENSITIMLKQSSHPKVLILHFIFRILALVLYILANFVTSNFILIFVLSVLFLSFDFWIVKNLSGRLLVGLRWWSEVDEEGKTSWYFESREASLQGNPIDTKVFWISLYTTPIIWILLGLIALIRLNFQWLLIIAVAITLSITNFLGYYKCDKDARKKYSNSNTANQPLFNNSGLMGTVINSSMSRFFG